MRPGSWFLGCIVGLLTGLIVAVPKTIADWRLNPSWIFRDEQGTNWPIVAETAFRWFWPAASFELVVTVLSHAWVSRTRIN